MQASLPKFVRMVSVEDFGQGTEAVRILGIKWLPIDPASTHAGENTEKSSEKNIERVKNEPMEKETVSEMDGRDGKYINVEIAFAYRARPQTHSIRKRAKCLHLYIAFYLPSGIKFRKSKPYVEMRKRRKEEG